MKSKTPIFSTRQLFVATVLLAAGISQSVNAITPRKGWADSYSANGKCYCATTFDHGIGEYRVDTPAGRKTVREVCRALGRGPGKGRNPSYNTVQCGHEPGHDDAIRIGGRLVKDEKVCPGRVDRERESDCQTKGPRWDLSVFGSPSTPRPTPRPTPPPTSNAEQRCTVIADSRSEAESLFSSRCRTFRQSDCDPITVAGQNKEVCSSLTIANDAAIAISANGGVTMQAEDYDRAVDNDNGNRGNSYRQGNVDIQATRDSGGGFNVGWMGAGEWLAYDLYITESADYSVELRVASTRDTGMFSIRVDGDVRASNVSVPYTGDWQQFQTIEADLGRLEAGHHVLRFDVNNGPFNLNWLRLEAEGGSGTPPSNGDVEISTVISGNSVQVEALPTISASNIRQVELFINGRFVRVERVKPYNWNVTPRTNDTALSNLSRGNHTLRVVVTDNAGRKTEGSKSITIN